MIYTEMYTFTNKMWFFNDLPMILVLMQEHEFLHSDSSLFEHQNSKNLPKEDQNQNGNTALCWIVSSEW